MRTRKFNKASGHLRRLAAALLGCAAIGTADAAAAADVAPPRFAITSQRGDKPVLDSGTIRFMTSGDFPPFNFMD
ncbi:hypothetical protein J8J27_24095, partial [Mycobacterium tuberculosis]|nr:hypothetical protein [Mycobacterium tuberculosis]